jgi:hypothetical protein
MKTLLSSLLIFIGIFSVSAQDIPNASFENWHPYSLGEYPDFWSTSDSVAVALGGGTSVFKGTDPYDGNLSLHLKSVTTTFGISGPGVATNGVVTLSGSTFIFKGGSLDTARSRFFTTWYKYTPANATDAAVVKVYLLKWNSTTSIRDTIADAVSEISDTTSTYTQLVLAMNFRDFQLQPDSCLIIFQSSRGLNDPTLGVGSEFVVDSLGFSGWVGVNELPNSINSVNIFPSPADNQLTIDVDLKNNISLGYEIYDMNGRLLITSKMNSTKEVVDVSNLSSGRYILKLNDGKDGQLYSTPISIVR